MRLAVGALPYRVMIADLRRDLRLGSLLQERAEEGTLGAGAHNLAEGDVIPPEAIAGTATRDADGVATRRFGVGGAGGLPQTSILARATEMPTKPCALCVFWAHDAGQTFLDREGITTVPKREGGFLRPGRSPMVDDQVAGGAYDSREVGVCKAARRSFRLSHRFATCEKWAAIGKFDRR